MDPIKVDFTGGTGKVPTKGKAIVLPPNRAGLKTVINIIGTIIIAAIAYYFYLPAFNFKAVEMYFYFGMILAGYMVMTFITSGAIKSPEYTPYARKRSKVAIIIAAAFALVMIVGFIISSPFFRAKSYSKIIDVKTADFSEDIKEADWDSVPLLDSDTTEIIANKALSNLVDLDGKNLVSQFTVYPSYIQINYKSTPVRIATLQYSNIIKWLTNRKDGLPGFLVIDMRTQKVDLVKVEGGMIYSNADHFNHLLIRHIRFKYPTALLGTPVFEINESGDGYWICPILDKTIGLFGGTDVKGAVLVDPTTGECSDYTVEQLKEDASLQWIDRVFDSNLLVEQYNYYGRYGKGFWNSILGQKEVVVTTADYNYLALDDDVWMYTGVTSINSDDSIVGFTLINQRTKEAKYYRVNGATEAGGREAAEGLVQDYEYKATFPLLLNIGGQPTYLMALKDSTQIVQQYAMVNVDQWSTIRTNDTTRVGCLNKYIELLEKEGISIGDIAIDESIDKTDGETDTKEEAIEISGTVSDIRTAVIGGNSVYYIKLDSSDSYYSVNASKFEDVIIVSNGSKVTISVKKNEGAIIPAAGFTID